ncbi:MAG TPA: PilZ domain-containing protein [Spirochaetia bacterium]|nr:PilZ domain-containing protein [Spirochaetia bacterium]
MVYGNQAAIRQFLASVAQGFVQTPIELVLLLGFVLALVLVFVGYFVVQTLRADAETRRRSRELLDDLVQKLSLNADDMALLRTLATSGGKGTAEYLLLVNRHIFDACARHLLQAGKASEFQLNALRLKAGFRLTETESVPASSAELPEGSSLLLQWAPQKQSHAVILAQEPALMTARLDGGSTAPPRGIRLRVAFHNASGIFFFATTVAGSDGSTLHLEHSSSIQRFQRRRYYRRKERLPVFIWAASLGASAGESTLLDLGGGGASLENPRRVMKEGDLLEMSFSPGSDTLTLPARVLRVSPGRGVIHVKFESPSESQRNRIMGFLFHQSKAG